MYDLATFLVVMGAIPAWVFPFLYHHRSRGRWRHSALGWHLMAMTVVIGLFLTLAATVRLFGPYPGIAVVAVILYGAVDVLLWQRVILMLSATRERP